MSGLFPAAACMASGCSPEQEERKQRILTPALLLSLAGVLGGSGKGPLEVFKSERQQPGGEPESFV